MRFVHVQVEEHDAIPEGGSMRFRAQEDADGVAVTTIVWESDEGVAGTWHVVGRRADGADVPAIAYAVDDSSAGTSILITGSDHGLRLTRANGDGSPALGADESAEAVAEAYLLVSRAALGL